MRGFCSADDMAWTAAGCAEVVIVVMLVNAAAIVPACCVSSISVRKVACLSVCKR
jgi:hypothetical protein